MVDKWRASTWGEEISLEYGRALRSHGLGQGRYRVFGANGPIGWTSEPLAPGPGVILGRKGAYRGVAFSREPFFVIDTAYYVVPRNDLDMRWLYYAIKHYKLGEVDDGSPIPSTTRAAVYMLDVDVPPLEEQRAIARILSTLDDKIELNRKMSATLESLAQALFKSWFVDFDPVRAKTEGRDPGLPKEIADHFPGQLVDTEIGDIPATWSIKRADELFDIGIGKTPPRKEHEWFSTDPNDVPWMSIRDMGAAHTYISQVSEYLTRAAVERFRIRQIPADTITLSFKLTVGRVAITESDMVSNEAIAHFLPRSGEGIGREYLYCYLRQFDYQRLGSTSSIATAVNSDSVRQIPLLVPTSSIHGLFQLLTFPIFERIKCAQRQITVLCGLRDSLLPKLISGALRVSQAERLVGRVA